MKITLLLADFARVANGKLDVIGGGWSMMNAQGPFGFFVAALFQIPWDQTNTKHTFRLELLDADGQGVPTPDGEAIRAEASSKRAGRRAYLRGRRSTRRWSFRSARSFSRTAATKSG